MQSESAAQLVLQAVAPHTYGVHCVVAAEGQVPVPLQEPAGAQAGRVPCGAPAVTVVQAPTLPGTSQASHWPAQAAVQQTPSAQTPPAHSPAPPQAVP